MRKKSTQAHGVICTSHGYPRYENESPLILLNVPIEMPHSESSEVYVLVLRLSSDSKLIFHLASGVRVNTVSDEAAGLMDA